MDGQGQGIQVVPKTTSQTRYLFNDVKLLLDDLFTVIRKHRYRFGAQDIIINITYVR